MMLASMLCGRSTSSYRHNSSWASGDRWGSHASRHTYGGYASKAIVAGTRLHTLSLGSKNL